MNRKLIGFTIIILGLIPSLAAVGLLFRPVSNLWGQACGSVLVPAELIPLSNLTRTLEEAAFNAACPEAWSPLIYWAVGLAALSAVLFSVGTLFFMPDSKSGGKRIQIEPKRQLTDELERVQNLYQSGGLTDEEYVAAKLKLLGDSNASN